MRAQQGVLLLSAVLIAAGLSGCASASAPAAVPTSTAVDAPTSTPSPTPSPTVSMSSADAEAQQRAEAWLAATPVPPGAQRTESSPSSLYATQWQGWVCTPTMTVIAYWTVEDMTPGEAMNWMIANPTPGLVLSRTAPDDGTGDYDMISMGATPEGDSLQGIAFTYAKMPAGSAIRAEVGATPTGAICPTPPDGGVWGGPGEG